MARKITFLRHGNAVAPYEGAPDKMRILSDKGREQAQKRREQLGKPKFDLVICSQTIRTAETALEVAGEDNEAPVVMLCELFTPHSGPAADALNRLFGKLGHQPLSAYYADEPNDVARLRQFGKEGWNAILNEISLKHSEYKNTLVVGHDMYLASMTNEGSSKNAGCLMDLIQGECEGFVVELFDELDDVFSIAPLPSLE